MPCDAHRSWKKGDCPSCGTCRCCPPPSNCDPELGRHTCSSVSSPTAGSKGRKKQKPSSASASKKRKRRAPSTPTSAPASAPPKERNAIPPPSVPSDKQMYQVGDTVFAEDKSHMLWEAIIKNTKLEPTKRTKDNSAAAATHEWKYLVHYQGWNARWDRWTDGSDLRPDDPAVRAESKRRHDEAAERERERKARQKEKREQSVPSPSARKRKKSAGSNGGEVGMSDDAASDGNTAASKSKPAKRRKVAASPTATSTKKSKQASNISGSRSKPAGPPSKEYVQSALEACCSLPFTLRVIMVDDKAKITRLGRYVASGYDDVRSVPNWTPPRMVHALPSALPVKILLKKFWKERKKSIKDKAKAADYSDLEADDIAAIKERQATEESKWKNFLQGLLDIFDEALAPFLLYNQERTHYLAARMDPKVLKMEDDGDGGGAAGRKPSDVYGAEHLLRLFVRLPQIVASSGATTPLFPDRASLISFAECTSDLIVHLQKNKTTCFKGRYREPKEIEWTWEEAQVVKQCAVGDEVAGGDEKGA